MNNISTTMPGQYLALLCPGTILAKQHYCCEVLLTNHTKGQYTRSAVVSSILVDGKFHLHTTKGKDEHCLIQLLIAKVGKARNYNHQELLNHGLNNKYQQDMVAVSHNTGISISYRQL